ncbi:apolipophorins-like [Octopus vulgaris]|uniref:Apolipophorins-like n=1 Tax=Octopus vulgaris TaxID=6645 RepID=A0AA36BXB0_OCTVU|nr:apolipophorins-like [Octopus vulgaris]
MDYFAVILVVAVVVSGGQAGIIKRNHGNQEQICATNCLGTRKFNYEVGSSYEYDYNAQTTTKMNGASHDGASFSLNARVVFEPVTKCDMVMMLNNVRVTNMDYAPEGQQFSDALMKQGLRFSFQDGKIEEVCPMSEEPTWVLNIKRGILSAFQNTMDDLDRDVNITETDVVGKCLTEYKVQDIYRGAKTIHKSKDLLSCSDREYYRIAMHSVKYNVHSKVRSMPLMKSYHNCVQTLDAQDNILTKSECTEENIFRPFSNGKSGAMTEQTQKLTFREKSSSNYRQTERFSHRSDLLFDHKETMHSDQLPTQEILSVFEELCDKMSEDIRPELPKMLNNLIDLMKSVDYATLRRIYSDISKEGFCRKNSDRTKIHVLSTVHISQPLLDNKNISHNVMLSISSMAASYCNKNPKCAEDFEIGALIQKYMSFVGDCDKDANPHVIQALRSLGNIGFSSKAERTLSKCVTTTSFPMEVRVSAIDAFRRIPCDARRSALMEVFVNTEEDSELRINAYLGLMKCPSQMLIIEIHEMLERENSNQVGSFIWSHLKNLRQTSDPHLQHIRLFLVSEDFSKKFNLDKRKFSRNYEGSFFSKDMNAGAKLDSNVIFSPKSFIPRSANLNLTLDLFGHAINILEVGGRMEDFERQMERMWSSHRWTNRESYQRGKSPMYLRFFGNEIFYGDTSRSFFFFRWSYFLTLFKTMQIVNSQVKYPTAIGFPLEMNVKATAAINNNDQTKWKQDGLDLAIKFSAVIEVSGDMTVDAHLTRMGLKMVSMAHTSTGVEFLSHNKELTIKFPQDIIEYANIKTDFYTVTGEKEKKLQLITDNVQKSKVCTDKSVEHLLGLKFCQEIRYSNASQLKDAPYFPFTGPAHYSYYMENVDVPKGYRLTKTGSYPNKTIKFETEGSKLPRKFLISDERDALRLYAETPWRNMKFRAYTSGEFKNLTSKATLNLDKHLEYKFVHNWLIESGPNRNGFTWTNNLMAKGPEHSGELKSSLEYRPNVLLNMEATATSSEFKPIVASLKLRNDKKSLDATGLFKNGPEEYTLNFNMSTEYKNYAYHFKPKMKIIALKKVVMDFDSQLVATERGRFLLILKLNKMKMKPFVISKPVLLNGKQNILTFISCKKRPVLNFNVKGRTVKGIGKLSTSFVAVYTNPSSREKWSNNLKFNTLLTYASAGVTRKYDYILSVVDSKKDINFQVKSKHFHIHSWPLKKIENNFMMQVSPRSVIKTEMYLSNIMTKGRRNSIAKLSYDYNGERMELNEELNQISGNAYKNKIDVQWATGRMVTLKTSLKNNPKVMFVENTLGLPNQREAKLTTTVNKAHRDYGATIEFHADKEIIPTKEDIDWKAVSTIKYNIKRYEASMDTTLLLEWAPDKRIRAAASSDIVIQGKSTAKISITTPFKVIQSYSESLEYEVSNRKYTYSANAKWKSYNKENKWTEKLILNYDNNEYYYKYRHYYGNKITEVETSWNFKDYQKSMIFLLKYDNRPFIDMKVTHSKDRQQMNLDSSFAFDMFDKGGKFTTAFHSDYRETTLSGDFEHEYPNYYNERVQVGGSYKMKHNNDVSSVLLQYTNVNSQKSKISVELNKDLPRNLKGKVYILHDDRQLLKMDADYTRTNDNFDMNVDLTGSNSKKMTASANVNLSGRRKTSHAEIRTDSMDVSVDGAIEYHTDHMDGEIRIGSGGKDLLLSGNYKRDSPNHKVSVNLGLPNSKHIKAIATFKDGAEKTLSFNVDSPDFPSLTKIQADISYLSDYKGITISSSGAVMPYLEKSHFHLYLPKTLLYGSWTDPRNDFSLELSLKSTSRFNSDFLFHYDHMSKVQWEMSVADFNGELLMSSDKSLLKGKFQNAVDLSISYLNQPREIDAKLNLKTRRAKVNIEIEPKKNNYKADLTFMHKRKEVSIGGSYEVAGQKKIIKANLKSPSFEENLFITVSGKQNKFKVMAKLQQNNIALELSASNNGKSVDMNLFFPKGKARLNFEGELQRFKAFTSVTIDNKEYKFDLSNQNNLEGVLAEITTPQFGTTEFRFDFNAEKPRLKASITLPNQHYGITAYPKRNGFITEFDLHFDRVQKHKQLKLVMSYVNADDRRTFFRQMSVKLSDKYVTLTANLHLKATYGLYLVMSEFSWGDKDDQKVGAELQIKHSDKKEVLLILTTPRRNSKVAASLESRQNQHTAMFTVLPDTSKGNEKFELTTDISGGHNRMHMDMTIRLPKHKNVSKIPNIFSSSSSFSSSSLA